MARWGRGSKSSGGSAANTCAVAAALGARVGFLGKVAADGLGQVFGHDIRAAGVHFPTAPLGDGAPTARCLILVTPDGQRTMNTFLGACVHFAGADVDAAEVARARVVYLEGYLFDPPAAQAAFRAASRAAHAAGRQVALTLSDPFCVRAPPPGLPPLRAGGGGHPLRQRGGNPLPLRGRRFRGRGRARPRRMSPWPR